MVENRLFHSSPFARAMPGKAEKASAAPVYRCGYHPHGRGFHAPGDANGRMIRTMPRPIAATIHTEALAHNLARARAGRPTRASGRWSRPTPTATASNAPMPVERRRRLRAAARSGRGRAVRELGWRGPILLLEGVLRAARPGSCARASTSGMWCTTRSRSTWLAAAQDPRAATRVPEDEQRHEPPGFRPQHLARPGSACRADAGRRDHADDALRRCRRPRGMARSWRPFEAGHARAAGERSLSNSAAATLRFAGPRATGHASQPTGCAPASWSTARRPTSRRTTCALGSAAGDDAGRPADRHPAAAAGDRVGYGGGFTAEAADAHRRGRLRLCRRLSAPLPTGTPVLVNGVRTRTVGRVSMDMITVDLDAGNPRPARQPRSRCGARANGSLLPIDEVARSAGTVGYELMCALAPRVPVSVDMTGPLAHAAASSERRPRNSRGRGVECGGGGVWRHEMGRDGRPTPRRAGRRSGARNAHRCGAAGSCCWSSAAARCRAGRLAALRR